MRKRITPRQRLAADLLSTGLSDKEIAARLGVSRTTVKTFLHHLFVKCAIPFHGPRHPRVILGIFWNCELFQIGLREMGLI